MTIATGIVAADSGPGPALMPWPQRLEWGEGQFALDDSFALSLEGPGSDSLRPYAIWFMRRLAGRTGLFFLRPEPLAAGEGGARLRIGWRRLQPLAIQMEESYRLRIDASGIALQAETDLGVRRGLETLSQLLGATGPGGSAFPAVEVDDRPRFAWRGLLIDSCRHFLPQAAILRNLEAMAMVKMNVLHWHLSENQGFRVECLAFPRLHGLGSDGLYYTQEQVREVVRRAAELGIRVMPEFDIPGHSTSWLVGYPELGAGPGPYRLDRLFGVMDPTLDPSRRGTYRFLEKFFREMARLFPDPCLHIGGDEVNGNEWRASARIRAFMRRKGLADLGALQNHFNSRVQKTLAGLGKTMVGWDEILVPGLDPAVVVHSWRGREGLAAAVRRGHRAILSAGWYIDLLQPTADHYRNDPLPDEEASGLSEQERGRVLGGEATMWSELVNDETVDSRIWPRTAAIAERLWSAGSRRDPADMFRRLDRISPLLEEAGVGHIKNRGLIVRRLAAGGDAGALACLAELVEPLPGYQRHSSRVYTVFSPLSRLADAAVVDPRPAREFEALVAGFLERRDEASARELIAVLETWRAAALRLPALAAAAPALCEALPLGRDLAQLARIGVEAANLILQRSRAEEAWLDAARAAVLEAGKPKAEVTLRPARSILPLLDALVPAGRREKEE